MKDAFKAQAGILLQMRINSVAEIDLLLHLFHGTLFFVNFIKQSVYKLGWVHTVPQEVGNDGGTWLSPSIRQTLSSK